MQDEWKLKYDHLKAKVQAMLDTQQSYFKTRDQEVLKKAKAMEAEVREIINPKPKPQLPFDFLAQ
jgi:ElaB/YqjD/DUF883 family membrane-anchored ribosome-binding protein